VMLKVTQDDAHWSAGAKLTTADGKALTGAKFRATAPAAEQ
jgi:hypothetical protein